MASYFGLSKYNCLFSLVMSLLDLKTRLKSHSKSPTYACKLPKSLMFVGPCITVITEE